MKCVSSWLCLLRNYVTVMHSQENIKLNFCYLIYMNSMLERVQGRSVVQAVSLSPRWPGFDPRPFCVGFMTDRMALGRIVFRVLPPVFHIHPFSYII
jgi:hypothetical protein